MKKLYLLLVPFLLSSYLQSKSLVRTQKLIHTFLTVRSDIPSILFNNCSQKGILFKDILNINGKEHIIFSFLSDNQLKNGGMLYQRKYPIEDFNEVIISINKHCQKDPMFKEKHQKMYEKVCADIQHKNQHYNEQQIESFFNENEYSDSINKMLKLHHADLATQLYTLIIFINYEHVQHLLNVRDIGPAS